MSTGQPKEMQGKNAVMDWTDEQLAAANLDRVRVERLIRRLRCLADDLREMGRPVWRTIRIPSMIRTPMRIERR